ncbi:hypothetical protein OFN61_31850, partial [Escherichia coli]|nr:hypothetical protein [Escherichia coli]
CVRELHGRVHREWVVSSWTNDFVVQEQVGMRRQVLVFWNGVGAHKKVLVLQANLATGETCFFAILELNIQKKNAKLTRV